MRGSLEWVPNSPGQVSVKGTCRVETEAHREHCVTERQEVDWLQDKEHQGAAAAVEPRKFWEESAQSQREIQPCRSLISNL